MSVKSLIEELLKYPGHLEVSITDGFNGYCYTTDNIEITLFEADEKGVSLDIGIGGNLI